MSGNHRYDNIAMWLENENGEGIIPLTSGMSYTGTYFPESADAIFKHTFSGNAAAEMEQYSAYNEVAYVTAEPRDGGAFFEFPEGGTSTRGVVAVSYTHLDVYKRQYCMWAAEISVRLFFRRVCMFTSAMPGS